MMDRNTGRTLGAYTVVIALVMLAPLVVIMAASFTGAGYVTFPPQGFSLQWYVSAVQDSFFVQAFVFSLGTALVVALAAGVLGVAAALAVHRYRFPGRGAVVALLMAPFMVPHIVLAVGITQLLSTYGIAQSPYGLVGGHIVLTLPFVVRLVLAGMSAMDDRLEAASRTLGASAVRTFTSVTLPLIGPSLAAGMVFAFLLSFDETGISVFTALPGATTLPAAIYQYAEQRSSPTLTAVSAMLIVFGFVTALILERGFGLLRLLSGGART